MVTSRVRVYIEGGARGASADGDFRKGWKKFLAELHDVARNNGFHSLEVVRGLGRSRTFELFQGHSRQNPDDLCVLLVDAETGVPPSQSVWQVVGNRVGDQWSRPPWAHEEHLYLMTQFVETWLLTDQDALSRFFGRGFKGSALPTTDLESRSKGSIETALKAATKDTGKGVYRHGQSHLVIGHVDPGKVKTLHHGHRLFTGLAAFIQANRR